MMICLLISAATFPLLIFLPPYETPTQTRYSEWVLSSSFQVCCNLFTFLYNESTSSYNTNTSDSNGSSEVEFHSIHNFCAHFSEHPILSTTLYSFINCLRTTNLFDCQNYMNQTSFNSTTFSSDGFSTAFQLEFCSSSCIMNGCITSNIYENLNISEFSAIRNNTIQQMQSCNLDCRNTTGFLHNHNMSFAERWMQRVETAGKPVMKERTSEFELSRTYLLVWVIRTVAISGLFSAFPIWEGIVMAELRANRQTADYGKVRIGSSVGQIVSSFLMGFALDLVKDAETQEISYYPCYLIIALCLLLGAIALYFYQLPESMLRNNGQRRAHFSDIMDLRTHTENSEEKQVQFESPTFLPPSQIDSTHSTVGTNIKHNCFFRQEKKSINVPNNTLAALSLALHDPTIVTFLVFTFNTATLYGGWYNYTFWYLKKLNATELNVSLTFTVSICSELLGIFIFHFVVEINFSQKIEISLNNFLSEFITDVVVPRDFMEVGSRKYQQ